MVPLTSYLSDHLSADERANADAAVREDVMIDPAQPDNVDPHLAREAAHIVADEALDDRLRSMPAALQTALALGPLAVVIVVAAGAAFDVVTGAPVDIAFPMATGMALLAVVALLREGLLAALHRTIRRRANRLLTAAGLGHCRV